MFDYGDEKNVKIYGQHTPREIDLAKIREVKIALIVGEQDLLANPKDVEWLHG